MPASFSQSPPPVPPAPAGRPGSNLGIARQIPSTQITKIEDVERAVVKTDRILGPIPTVEELKESLKSVEELMEQERLEAEAIAEIAKKDRAKQISGEDRE